jgi:hypothetical protein
MGWALKIVVDKALESNIMWDDSCYDEEGCVSIFKVG